MISSSSSMNPLFLKKNQFNARADFNELKEKTKERDNNKKSKFITTTEGGYVRCYLVKEDGTKILLSETKQNQDDKGSDNSPLFTKSKSLTGKEDEPSSATKEMMMLLNLNAGIPINVLKQLYQEENN